MKKIMLTAIILATGLLAYSQGQPAKTNETQKWKVRLRVIDAIPVSNSYDLGGGDYAHVSSSVMPELDFSYFFSPNLAAELILGTTQHTASAKGPGGSTDLGTVWLLPPTLDLQYHFAGKTLTPYIGAGINYSMFYGVKDKAATLKYKNSVGFSTQLGMDYNISSKWFLNLDIKKLFLKTDVTVVSESSAVLSGVKLDPFIIGLGIGTRF